MDQREMLLKIHIHPTGIRSAGLGFKRQTQIKGLTCFEAGYRSPLAAVQGPRGGGGDSLAAPSVRQGGGWAVTLLMVSQSQLFPL